MRRASSLISSPVQNYQIICCTARHTHYPDPWTRIQQFPPKRQQFTNLHGVTSKTNWLLKVMNVQPVKEFPHSIEPGTSIPTYKIPYSLFISVPCSQKTAVGRCHQVHEYSRENFLLVFKCHCQVPKYWLIFDICHDTLQASDLLIQADMRLYVELADNVTLKPECMSSSNNNNNKLTSPDGALRGPHNDK